MKNIIQWFFSLTFIASGIAGLFSGHILSATLFILAGIAINPILINRMRRQSEFWAKDTNMPVAYMPVGIHWIASIILGLFAARFNPEFGKKKETPQQATQVEPSKEWFQGGTLHNCTNAEWKASTQENKVATCSDWIVALAKSEGLTPELFRASFSMEQLKQMSENMAKEVNASANAGISADNMRGECATYATFYWTMLKAKAKENTANTQ